MLDKLLYLITPTTLLVFFVTLLLVYYVMTMPRMLNMPPGPFPLPLLGSFHVVARPPKNYNTHIFHSFSHKYGKIYSIKLGSIYMVVISDHKLLTEALVKNPDVFSYRPSKEMHILDHLNKTLGLAIITTNGDMWKLNRKTALMAMRDFGMGKSSLEERIQEEVRVLLDCFSQKKGEPFNAKPLFNLATSNVICNVIFGSRFEYDDETFKELLRVMDKSLSINPILQPVNFLPVLKYIPYFKNIVQTFSKTFHTTQDFIHQLTERNEKTFDPENIRDFVDLFIKSKRETTGEKGSEKRNMARVITELFLAGSDTTAVTLSWAMLLMAKYPDIQARCQKEIDSVLGKSKQCSGSDKDKLPYVEATIFEVMRLRPVLPFGVPYCTSADTKLAGYSIPRGTVIMPNIAFINKDPETFETPDEFNPDHFLDANGKVCNKDRMVSFSIGPRSCLGELLAKQELFLFFTSILQFFTVSPEPGTEIVLDSVFSLILRNKPQNVVFTRRE